MKVQIRDHLTPPTFGFPKNLRASCWKWQNFSAPTNDEQLISSSLPEA